MKTTTVSKKAAPVKNAAPKSAAAIKKNNPGDQSQAAEETPFEKLFLSLLKDIYWAEQHLVEALQKMADAATTETLKDAFADHKYITQKHVTRLEKAFGLLGQEPEAKKCDAMAGLIKESEHVIEETEEGSMTRDAGLIIAAQKVEHYEIASYGSIVQVALTLGHDDVATLLEKTLSEEEDTDALLTDIAESDINPMADQENGEDSETGNESEQATT